MPEGPERSADPNAGRHLILYDGLCGLCNRLNQFVLPRDSRGTFVFASLQSRVGRELVTRFGRNPDDLDTFFVISNYRRHSARLLSKSAAALFVAGELDAPWSWLRLFGVLPSALRDWGYDLIARNRYRVFGRYESCLLPTAEYKQRFVDV
jgi:predicted DCC family thiol-disulfide oxidoreductase YuxK